MVLDEKVIKLLKTDTGQLVLNAIVKEAKMSRSLTFNEKEDYYFLGKKDLAESLLKAIGKDEKGITDIIILK